MGNGTICERHHEDVTIPFQKIITTLAKLETEMCALKERRKEDSNDTKEYIKEMRDDQKKVNEDIFALIHGLENKVDDSLKEFRRHFDKSLKGIDIQISKMNEKLNTSPVKILTWIIGIGSGIGGLFLLFYKFFNKG
jgi:CRISPR/Cas system-associated protein Cas10 (large subunit of type III CRISPR-Cas system)